MDNMFVLSYFVTCSMQKYHNDDAAKHICCFIVISVPLIGL